MDEKLLETLALIAGVLLSLIMEIPVIKREYDKLGDMGKRAVMAVLLILAGALLYGLACAGILAVLLSDLIPGLGLTCDQAGILLLARLIVWALVSNQGTFGLLFRGRKKKAITA